MWGTPPLVIDGVLEERAMGLGSSPHSGETWGSRMMPAVHSVLVFERCKLDGRLFFLESDGFIRISWGIGVVGGVENVSPSGDGGNAKAEGMVMVEGKNVRDAYTVPVACTPGSGRTISNIYKPTTLADRGLSASKQSPSPITIALHSKANQ